MALSTKWGDPSYGVNGNGNDPVEGTAADETEDQKKRHALAYLKALRESTKAHTKKYIPNLDEAWGYTIGEARYPSPSNQAAKQMEKHLSRTVRNQMFQMMDHKVSFVTDAEPRVTMHALQDIGEDDRRKLESILMSELERGYWEEDKLQVAWDCEIASIGMVMFYKKVDDLTDEVEICTKVVDPSRVGVDRKATNLRNPKHVTYTEDISLAEIREMWPVEGLKVRPNATSAFGVPSEETYVQRTDDEIVTMPGNEFIVSKDGQVVDQSATVTWAWEDRPETREIWEEKNNAQDAEGWYCPECDANFIADEQDCPECGASMEPVTVPKGAKARSAFTTKQYPYGRCLIGIPEQGILFYDGENELPLDRIYPFAGLWCYRRSRSFYGVGDYHLLKSNQKARDQNINLLRDHLRYNAHPILEYPNSAEIYRTIGNAPGQLAGVDDELCGLARMLSGAAFDYQGFQACEVALDRDAKEITSVDEILTGGGPGPESGEAQKTRIQAKSKRIGGFLKRYNEFQTDYAAIKWELMSKLYTTPRTFNIKGPANQLTAITETLASLPYDIVVSVSADPDKVETDRLIGQNLGQFITSGSIFKQELLPFMDTLLSGFGVDPWKAEKIQQSLAQFHQQQAQMPPPPPQDPSKVLVAMSDILKVMPTGISYAQIQEGLAAAGITPEQHAPLPPNTLPHPDLTQLHQTLAPNAPVPVPPEPQGATTSG